MFARTNLALCLCFSVQVEHQVQLQWSEPIVAVLKIGLGLETTFQGSQSRRLEGIFTRSRLGLGPDGFRIFGQDSMTR